MKFKDYFNRKRKDYFNRKEPKDITVQATDSLYNDCEWCDGTTHLKRFLYIEEGSGKVDYDKEIYIAFCKCEKKLFLTDNSIEELLKLEFITICQK